MRGLFVGWLLACLRPRSRPSNGWHGDGTVACVPARLQSFVRSFVRSCVLAVRACGCHVCMCWLLLRQPLLYVAAGPVVLTRPP